MIDIIIPCYNSHATIDRCIGSILCQTKISECKAYLVNDGGKDYKQVISRYSDVLDIQEIGYSENGGPGKARNYGIQHSKSDYIMFIDSDDVLASPVAIENLLNTISSDTANMMVISDFIEEISPSSFKVHENDISFMHGKIYRRRFLEKYNILANENTNSNEDMGFNLICMLLLNQETEKSVYLSTSTYYWLNNQESLVRKNREAYDHGQVVKSFVENLTYVYEQIDKKCITDDKILLEKVTSMQRLFLLYIERVAFYPRYHDDVIKAFKDFYKRVYQTIENQVSDELFVEVFKSLGFKDSQYVQLKDFINWLGEDA